MSEIETVDVGGTRYNIAQASAVDQKKLLHLLGARITYNVGKNASIKLDNSFLFGALMALPENDFDEVALITLYKTVKNGDTKVVEVADFQGRITEYYQLVAEAVRVNLADFMQWLESARQPNETEKKVGE